MAKKLTATDNWPEIERRSKAMLPAAVVDYIASVRKLPHHESHLIGVLHKVQGEAGHISQQHIDAVAQLLQVPAARVSGVATFYHFFRLQPKGQCIINVCMGTACYVKGADKVVARLRQELGIDFGQTTADNMFTLEQTRCLGTCGLAPVMMINEQVFAKVTPEQVPALLEKARCR
jgi:NADH-quinone oxidoreductase E subunit